MMTNHRMGSDAIITRPLTFCFEQTCEPNDGGGKSACRMGTELLLPRTFLAAVKVVPLKACSFEL